MLRKIVILNYNSFLGKVVIFINEKKKEENVMSVEFNKLNVGED